MKPSVGRVVHYRMAGREDSDEGYCVPAIVTGAYTDPSVADLAIFQPALKTTEYFEEVHTDPASEVEDYVLGHWHWPERVD